MADEEPPQPPFVISQDFSKFTPDDVLRLSTSAGKINLWLQWLIQNSRDQRMEGCVACAAARPAMYTEPAHLYPDSDPTGYACMLNLTKHITPGDCDVLASIYPSGFEKPGYFSAIRGMPHSYICFNFTASGLDVKRIGVIDPSWCNITVPGNAVIGPRPRMGLFYYCGKLNLYAQIKEPTKTSGVCAMVRLAMPITIIGNRAQFPPTTQQRLTQRRRRHVLKGPSVDPFDLAGGPT